ncbi:MAG: HAMP domain-containing histidine kinase [Lachnospiraceae bacterium]|nr:HAMP domain-containing histidine kinase [Lachnospiraceae bacterium]
MSSNQSNNVRGRMSSIRHRLAGQRVRMKMGMHFWHCIVMIAAMSVVWLAAREYMADLAVPFFERSRQLTLGIPEIKINTFGQFADAVRSVRYTVTSKAGAVILSETVFVPIALITGVSSGFMVLSLFFDLLSYSHELRRIKRLMAPIDEMALRVEELSRIEMSEEKYHLIEEKITSLEPTEEAKLSFGDEDLMGIERAMNSLLARIRESNRQQARFVNDASHELRTPIAVIEGYANMLARWGREDEKVLDESITAIQNESEHMKHLVEQLLFLARGDAGRTVLNPAKTDLCEMMQSVYEESLMIDEDHIYKYSCPVDPVFVMADEGMLKQSVRILVDNAAKYTKPKDEILLSVGYSDGGDVYVQVQDTGIGMKESDVEHMFERFYRSDEARSYGGTGLGLSIAKWIVDKHNGHFEITSREELGTRIRIMLKKVPDNVPDNLTEPHTL